MELKLNNSILTTALNRYIEEYGKGAIAELHRVSGVNNIGRISRGETVPTLDTWLQLYLSAREDIPPPTTISGGRLVLVGEEELLPEIASNVKAATTIGGEDKFFALYSKHRSPAVIKAFTEALERIEKATLVKLK